MSLFAKTTTTTTTTTRMSVQSLIITALILIIGTVSTQQHNGQYPTYSLDFMPDTSFSCRDKILGGYYADLETRCQMFHICVKIAGVGVQDFRFLCPNGTAFDQEHQICANWFDVDCEASVLYYSSDNFDLYRIGSGFESKPIRNNNEDEGTFHLQSADTGDARLNHQQQSGRINQRPDDIFHGSSSSNFFNNRNGNNEQDIYADGQSSRGRNDIPRDDKPSRKLVTTRRPLTPTPFTTTTTTTTTTTRAPPLKQQFVKAVDYKRNEFKQSVTENYVKITNKPGSTTTLSNEQFTTALNHYNSRHGRPLSNPKIKLRTNAEYDNNQSTPFDSQFTKASTTTTLRPSLFAGPTTFRPNKDYYKKQKLFDSFQTTKQPILVNHEYYTTTDASNLYESPYTSYNATTKQSYDTGKYVQYNPTPTTNFANFYRTSTTTTTTTSTPSANPFSNNAFAFDQKTFGNNRLQTFDNRQNTFNSPPPPPPPSFVDNLRVSSANNRPSDTSFNFRQNTFDDYRLNNNRQSTTTTTTTTIKPFESGQIRFDKSRRTNQRGSNHYSTSSEYPAQSPQEYSSSKYATVQIGGGKQRAEHKRVDNADNYFFGVTSSTGPADNYNRGQTNVYTTTTQRPLSFRINFFDSTTNPLTSKNQYNRNYETTTVDRSGNAFTTTKPASLATNNNGNNYNSATKEAGESLNGAFATHFASTRNEFLHNIKGAYFATTKKPIASVSDFGKAKAFEPTTVTTQIPLTFKFGANQNGATNNAVVLSAKPVATAAAAAAAAPSNRSGGSQANRSNGANRGFTSTTTFKAPTLVNNKLANRDNTSDYDYAYYDSANHFNEYEAIDTEFSKTKF